MRRFLEKWYILVIATPILLLIGLMFYVTFASFDQKVKKISCYVDGEYLVFEAEKAGMTRLDQHTLYITTKEGPVYTINNIPCIIQH